MGEAIDRITHREQPTTSNPLLPEQEEELMRSDVVIEIGGRGYTAEDIAAGKHRNDTAITDAGGTVHNINRGGTVGIQAGVITGDITFD